MLFAILTLYYIPITFFSSLLIFFKILLLFPLFFPTFLLLSLFLFILSFLAFFHNLPYFLILVLQLCCLLFLSSLHFLILFLLLFFILVILNFLFFIQLLFTFILTAQQYDELLFFPPPQIFPIYQSILVHNWCMHLSNQKLFDFLQSKLWNHPLLYFLAQKLGIQLIDIL